jgi:hypothetical protein
MTIVLPSQQLHAKNTVIIGLLHVSDGLIHIMFLLRRRRKNGDCSNCSGEILSFVTDVNINDNTEDSNDVNSRSSDFVTSSSFVPSTPLNVTVTSTNFACNTTQSFVLPQIEISLLPHAFSPSARFKNNSNSPYTLHCPMTMPWQCMRIFISGVQAVAV